jgi:hypothetical protein
VREKVILGALLLAVSGEASVAQVDVDRFVGRWVLDVGKSHDLGKSLSSMVIVMSAVEGGIHYRSETKYANSRVRVAEYTALYDGSISMVTGTYGVLAPVSLRRVSADRVRASYFSGMQVVGTSNRRLTGDGRMMMVTTTYRAPQRGPMRSLAIFKRAQ